MATSESEPPKKKLPFLKKAEREACWDARDRFWKCFEAAGEDQSPCKSQRDAFEGACPKLWVGHFDKKFYYEKFKTKMASEGYKKLDEEFQKEK